MKSFAEHLLKEKKPVPCLFYPAAKELGFSIEEILTDGAKQAELLVHIADHYPVGAVVRMTELWCEAAAFGMDVSFSDTDFPKLGAPVFDDPEAMAKVTVPAGRNKITAPLIDAVSLAVPKLSKPLVVGVTGPYTLGAVLSGSEEFMMNCMMEPELTEAFLSRAADFLIEYILEYKKAGASAVMIAEPSTGMISPDMMEEFSNTYLEKIIEAAADENFSVLYHNCGSVTPHLSVISRLSADGFHLGSQVDLKKAAKLIDADRLLMGNLEPQLFLGNHLPKILENREKLAELSKERETYLLSTGCDLSPAANLDAVRQVFTEA